jgi:hypothetical protein
MTLQEIADYAAAKVGLSDQTTIAKAKLFAQHRWKIIWNRFSWHQSRMQQNIAVPAGTQDVTLDPLMEFAIAARWNGFYELLVTSDLTMLRNFPLGLDTQGAVTGFDPLPRDSSGNARLRLYSIPKQDSTMLVIGKAKCPDLVNGTDSPSIPGADETLVASVQGDLMQWLRQYSKADQHFQEAGAHLANMMQIERDVAASDLRIVPVVEPQEYNSNWLQK